MARLAGAGLTSGLLGRQIVGGMLQKGADKVTLPIKNKVMDPYILDALNRAVARSDRAIHRTRELGGEGHLITPYRTFLRLMEKAGPQVHRRAMAAMRAGLKGRTDWHSMQGYDSELLKELRAGQEFLSRRLGR